MKTTWRTGRICFVLGMVCAWLATAGARGEGDIVINEIMYHPPNDLEDLQYVELFNRGSSKVDLAGWSFSKGVRFVFPARTVLAPGSFLVVCRNRSAFAKAYGTGPAALGDFSGKLKHRGEKIELADARGQVVDEVKFADAPPWPSGPDGYSASLERICPFHSGAVPENWAGSALPALEQSAGTPGRPNDSYSTNLPPAITNVQFKPPGPGQELTVTAEVKDADGVSAVSLLYETHAAGKRSEETEAPMKLVGGSPGQYQGALPAQPEGTLVRFRIKAVDGAGTLRYAPGPFEPRPAFSYSTFVNTNTARIALAYVLNEGPLPRPGPKVRRAPPSPARSLSGEPARGNSAFIYVPPGGGGVLTFDFVQVRPRPSGFKVHFQKDRPLGGMTGVNIIFEKARWVLAEPLAFELYRLAGVPASLTEHVRVWYDGRPLGYQLLIEQPNKAFLSRNRRATDGALYKAGWVGQGLAGQHEKKTQLGTGYADLIALHSGLTKAARAGQWTFIDNQFNVPEWAGYYAVNMCLQNWDGFFNNHYLCHDAGGTAKWEVYPWDEDKTWGDYDGASRPYRWYAMPLSFGMTGDQSRGGPWWRPAGWFSGALLANPQFRGKFLDRLEELCQGAFTEEKFKPVIDALEQRLEPEIPIRAQARGEDPSQALKRFHDDVQSIRSQLKHRRAYILDELPQARRSLEQARAASDATPQPEAQAPDNSWQRPAGPLPELFVWVIRAWIFCVVIAVAAVPLLVALVRRRRRRAPRPPPLPPPLPRAASPPIISEFQAAGSKR